MKIVGNILIVLGFASMLFAVEPTMNAMNVDGNSGTMSGELQQKRVLDNGGVSAEQRAKIKEILDKYRIGNKDTSDKLMEKRKELTKETEATLSSTTNISKLNDEIVVLQEKMKKNRENLTKEIDSVYTPEQLKKRNERIREQVEKAKKAKEANEANQSK